MKFFLDTANLDEIRQAATLGLADGVTVVADFRQLAAAAPSKSARSYAVALGPSGTLFVTWNELTEAGKSVAFARVPASASRGENAPHGN